MVRKIGFRSNKASAEKTTAEAYLDEFRARAAKQKTKDTHHQKKAAEKPGWFVVFLF